MLNHIHKLISLISPKDKDFFPLLEKATSNMVLTAEEMIKLVNSSTSDLQKHISEIKRLEHIGDEHTHKFLIALSKNFITPFDREDLHALIKVIDDIVDLLNVNARNINTYAITSFDSSVKLLVNLIHKGALLIHQAVSELKKIKNADKIKQLLINVNTIENEADSILHNSLKKLFEIEKDAINIIKHKSFLSNLESATDKCEDAANVIETILIKYA